MTKTPYINVSKSPEKSFKNGYLLSTLSGLKQTATIFFKQVFGLEKTATVQWPEEKYQYSERFKGKHFLTKRPDGRVRCTACFLCATNCPAECITIVAGESPDIGIEKFPLRFEIDILRCVFCGYCEEACPVDAIRMGPEISMASLASETNVPGATGLGTDRKWIYTKEYLLDREAVKEQIGENQVSKKEENVKLI